MNEYWEMSMDEQTETIVYKCDCCGEDISIGDEAYMVDDNKWLCQYCFKLFESKRRCYINKKAGLVNEEVYF